MRVRLEFMVVALTLLIPFVAIAQGDGDALATPEAAPSTAQAPQAPAPSQPVTEWEEQYPADPSDQGAPMAQAEAPPDQTLPPPPAEAPAEQASPAAQPEVPPGEWVQTEQYGWVWMPLADAYTYVPADGWGEPYMYLYRPAYGWSWFVAPWVWGFGPWPHFGFHGAAHFGWYGHGWWRTPERWHWVRASYGGGFRHDGGLRPFPSRPVPFHGAAPGRSGADFRGGGRMGGPAYHDGNRPGAFAPGHRGEAGGRGGFPEQHGSSFRGDRPRSAGGWSRGLGGGSGHGSWGDAPGGRGGGGAGWARGAGGRSGGGHTSWGGAGHGGGRGGGGHRSFGRR